MKKPLIKAFGGSTVRTFNSPDLRISAPEDSQAPKRRIGLQIGIAISLKSTLNER
jgi:microcystin-dependent protein